ncbi:deoxycytidylate deaminase [Endozoicomonas sp. SM1973]|uniref:Deoxycytidylate deaminase n=1 Tax=Spartinivicinus marinus TaxID=2994442 RepID=A0A853IHD7_9GAMM|nr:anti-phage dCTP deaminase [Spartinivicinus marinus]MCX4027888.1 anti-phage dCTP deaminase [Spartinivicinus marinus]NYZ69451.1 deoxycytidylate deaminase [Spartinivicinus marinus]
MEQAKISSEIVTEKKSKTPYEQIGERFSKEIIIALCGAIGSGVKEADETLERTLQKNHEYETQRIKLSDLIRQYAPSKANLEKLDGFEYYDKLQDAGDQLRKTKGNHFLAELAIGNIAIIRQDNNKNPNEHRVAYIINQIKNPDEIDLLRLVYPNNFYLIGIIRTEADRKRALEDSGIKDSNDINKLINKDKLQKESYSQRIVDCIYKSDFIIDNTNNNTVVENLIHRFLALVHGKNNITPTLDEVGMHEAYSASLNSSCLSRQVGAAIMDSDGNIVSHGFNDVPKFNGGLYSSYFHDQQEDNRCFNYRNKICHNDQHKQNIKKDISKIIKKEFELDDDRSNSIAEKIYKESKLKDLTEFSRAVHAEMAAIVHISRSLNKTAQNSSLYCTTYPCHSCARHIVCAGIKEVIYLEPYEKSLASKLHADSIICSSESHSNKVIFRSFSGVSPRRYFAFFSMKGNRKDEVTGKFKEIDLRNASQVEKQFLDGYTDYENKVLKHLEDVHNIKPKIKN